MIVVAVINNYINYNNNNNIFQIQFHKICSNIYLCTQIN